MKSICFGEHIDDYKKVNYYDYTAPSLILESLPNLERILNSRTRANVFIRPVGNAEIYLKPRHSTDRTTNNVA